MRLQKNFLRHEILNMFTVLKGIVEQEDFSRQNIVLMNKYIEASTLLVEYENLLLGGDEEFFPRLFPLERALKNACMLASDISGLSSPLVSSGVSIKLLGDEHHFQRALGYILAKHMSFADKVHLSYHEEDGALHIQCVPPFTGDIFRKKMEDSLIMDDVFFQTAIRILEAMRIKILFSQEKTLILFPPDFFS